MGYFAFLRLNRTAICGVLRCRIKSMKDDIQCCAGSSLSKEDCEACIVLIKQGGAVDLKSEELPHAEIVAIKRDGQAIVEVILKSVEI